MTSIIAFAEVYKTPVCSIPSAVQSTLPTGRQVRRYSSRETRPRTPGMAVSFVACPCCTKVSQGILRRAKNGGIGRIGSINSLPFRHSGHASFERSVELARPGIQVNYSLQSKFFYYRRFCIFPGYSDQARV
jgi:hypothetical protein